MILKLAIVFIAVIIFVLLYYIIGYAFNQSIPEYLKAEKERRERIKFLLAHLV